MSGTLVCLGSLCSFFGEMTVQILCLLFNCVLIFLLLSCTFHVFWI